MASSSAALSAPAATAIPAIAIRAGAALLTRISDTSPSSTAFTRPTDRRGRAEPSQFAFHDELIHANTLRQIDQTHTWGGLVEAAGDYEGTHFVSPADPAALAAALAELPGLRGHRFADPRSWDRTVDAYGELLRRIGAATPGHRRWTKVVRGAARVR